MSQHDSGLSGLPCADEEACCGLPDSGGFRDADHSGPHHLLQSQETQGLLLMMMTVGSGLKDKSELTVLQCLVHVNF